MFGIIARIVWRCLVFLLAAVVFYLLLFTPLPIHHTWQLILILAPMYILIAYVALPLLIRLWRVFIKPNHVPVYAITGDGWHSDPVNIAIVCRSRRQLVSHMQKAGWTPADPITLRSSAKMFYAMVFNKPYATAPFSNLYLFDRKQDIGFQIQEGSPPTPRHRHHVRFWRWREGTDEKQDIWQRAFSFLMGKPGQIWIGAATHDIAPIAFRFRTLQPTHKIDSDTNRERDFVIQSLKKVRAVRRQHTVTSGHALTFRGQTFGTNIIVDGIVEVVELR